MPFAFSAEPVRRRLRWLYGAALTWRPRMIVLTLEDGEAEKLAQGAPGRAGTAPSYEGRRTDVTGAVYVPGFNPGSGA